MPEDNIEIVRKLQAAFNEGGLEASLGTGLFTPDVVFEEPPEQPGAGVFEGDAGPEAFVKWEEAWEDHRSEEKGIRALDENRVLLETVEHFRGRAGIEVSQPCWTIFTLEDGLVRRWQPFWSEQRALDAISTEA